MKFSFPMLLSAVCGLGSGILLSWAGAHQWNVAMPAERLAEAVTFFTVSISLTVLLKSRNLSGTGEDAVRTITSLFGAALCFSLVRGEAILLVYSALWFIPGAFLGATLSGILSKRRIRMKSRINNSA